MGDEPTFVLESKDDMVDLLQEVSSQINDSILDVTDMMNQELLKEFTVHNVWNRLNSIRIGLDTEKGEILKLREDLEKETEREVV